MNTLTLSKAKQLKLIDEAYFAIRRALESGHYGDNLKDMIEKAEKQHRKFKPDGVTCGLTIKQATRLFFAQYIIGYYTKAKKWTIKDMIYVRHECLYAQSIAENYTDEIAQAIKDIDIDAVMLVDYAELNK